MQNSNVNTQGTFIKFIGYLQVIGIVLVVLGHSFHEYPDGLHGYTALTYRICYNFHMPLFMFVSGFLMMYTEFMSTQRPSIKRFGWSKIKRLLIPYIVLTIITYFPRVALSDIADDAVKLSISDFLKSLFVNGNLIIPFFWFIQASFLLLIFSYYILNTSRNYGVKDHICISSLLALFIILGNMDLSYMDIFSYKRAAYFGVFFIAGIAYCRYYSEIEKLFPLDSVLSVIIAIIIWMISFALFENTIYEKISSFFGIVMCIGIAKLMVKYNVTFFDHLVGANYMIFLLSWYFNILAQQVLSHYVRLPWEFHTLLSLTLGIYIPWLGYIYLRDHQHKLAYRFISSVLGQKFRK